MDEVWKHFEVFGYGYDLSNHGRLKNSETEHIYKQTNKNGDYFRRVLGPGYGKGGAVTVLMHRLVYELFVGEIPKGFHIHHIDGNKQNNRVDNLMAVSPREHAVISVREDPSRIEGMNYYNSVVRPDRIAQYSLKGELIATFQSAKAASDATGVCQRNILQVAHKTPFNKNGNYRKQAGGFIWRIAA